VQHIVVYVVKIKFLLSTCIYLLLLKHSVLVHVEHKKTLWPMASRTAEPIQKPLEQGCMYDARPSRIQTQATMVEGKCSHN